MLGEFNAAHGNLWGKGQATGNGDPSDAQGAAPTKGYSNTPLRLHQTD